MPCKQPLLGYLLGALELLHAGRLGQCSSTGSVPAAAACAVGATERAGARALAVGGWPQAAVTAAGGSFPRAVVSQPAHLLACSACAC